MVGAVVATKITGNIGIANTMVLGGIFQSLTVCIQAWPAYKAQNVKDPEFEMADRYIGFFLLLGAAIGGFGKALCWVAQGDYFS